jgi:hypothetical protein
MTGRKFISRTSSDDRKPKCCFPAILDAVNRIVPAEISRPTKVPGTTDNPPWSVQLEVSTCHARTIANDARTRMLIKKRRFSKNLLIDSFGGGTLSTGTRRIAVVFHPLDLR